MRPPFPWGDLFSPKVLVSMFDDQDRTLNAWFEEQLSKLENPTFVARIHRATAFKRARAHSLSIFDYVERQRGCAGLPHYETLL